MVDRVEYGTNRSYLSDFVHFAIKPCSPQFSKFHAKLGDLSQNQRLSARQIADELGVSKSTALKKLHSLGIRHGSGKSRLTDKDNYRAPVAPYGYQVMKGKLVGKRSEQRQICREVVICRRDKKLSFSAIARLFSQQGIKNRSSTTYWDHKVIQSIYNRWKDKF